MTLNKTLLSTSSAAIILAATLFPQQGFAFDLSNKRAEAKPAHMQLINAGFEQNAQDFISKMAKTGIDFLANPDLSLEQRKSEFKTLLSSNFDMKTIGRFSLGRYWKVASDSQKTEYLNLFEKNVIDVYSRRFGEYQGQEFIISGATLAGKADAMVHSYITSNGQKISIDWRVREKNGKMRVIDISVEGVSMASTQRSEFASIIQRGGGNVQVLIDHLKS